MLKEKNTETLSYFTNSILIYSKIYFKKNGTTIHRMHNLFSLLYAVQHNTLRTNICLACIRFLRFTSAGSCNIRDDRYYRKQGYLCSCSRIPRDDFCSALNLYKYVISNSRYVDLTSKPVNRPTTKPDPWGYSWISIRSRNGSGFWQRNTGGSGSWPPGRRTKIILRICQHNGRECCNSHDHPSNREHDIIICTCIVLCVC